MICCYLGFVWYILFINLDPSLRSLDLPVRFVNRMTSMSERIDVLAKFSFGRAWPEKFWWHGREYEVVTVNLIFQRKDGGKKYLCFSVSTSGLEAELRLDREELLWSIQT